MGYGNAKFEELKGKTLDRIEGLEAGSDRAVFIADDGARFVMHYEPDCCASCTIEDIAGEVADLLGSEILLAEEVEQSGENPDGVTKEYQDSFTWTFYKLATIKGSVTIRWYGESNGYYSESVTFDKESA
jgi:hypothetical protein